MLTYFSCAPIFGKIINSWSSIRPEVFLKSRFEKNVFKTGNFIFLGHAGSFRSITSVIKLFLSSLTKKKECFFIYFLFNLKQYFQIFTGLGIYIWKKFHEQNSADRRDFIFFLRTFLYIRLLDGKIIFEYPWRSQNARRFKTVFRLKTENFLLHYEEWISHSRL